MIIWKKMLALFLTGALVFTAGACKGKEKEQDEIEVTPNEAQEEVKEEESEMISDLDATISWWTYPVFVQEEGQEDGVYEQELIREFNKKYPNIKVNIKNIILLSIS